MYETFFESLNKNYNIVCMSSISNTSFGKISNFSLWDEENIKMMMMCEGGLIMIYKRHAMWMHKMRAYNDVIKRQSVKLIKYEY